MVPVMGQKLNISKYYRMTIKKQAGLVKPATCRKTRDANMTDLGFS
jgi:hypothetical protein